MNLDKLQQQLLAAARANPPSDRVPHAFEKRIAALLRDRPALDHWAIWARGLWRAAAPCVAIMFLLTIWSALAPGNRSTSTDDLSQELDNTVLAAVDQDQPADTW